MDVQLIHEPLTQRKWQSLGLLLVSFCSEVPRTVPVPEEWLFMPLLIIPIVIPLPPTRWDPIAPSILDGNVSHLQIMVSLGYTLSYESEYAFEGIQKTPIIRDDAVYQWLLLVRHLRVDVMEGLFAETLVLRRDKVARAAHMGNWILAQALNVKRLGLGTPRQMAYLSESPVTEIIDARLPRSWVIRWDLFNLDRQVLRLRRHIGAPVTEVHWFKILMHFRWRRDRSLDFIDAVWGIRKSRRDSNTSYSPAEFF
ncbi:hypothetical protein GGR57DRAFT_502330 [Xylariaceae sp. FL1272]|nr:hypothetical protein GGR57DRAFT_502330 [Xylariaceae sp. FL1272]